MSDGLTTLANPFQRLMLQWERLAPYNAGQYATLALSIDPAFAQLTWRDVVVTLGLQQIGQHPDAPVVQTVEPIELFISDALNRSFSPGDSPLRPFIGSDDAGHAIVGIAYRHVVADSVSIRHLMHAWLSRLLLRPATSVAGHIRLTRDESIIMRDRRWSLIRESLAELSRLSRAKRVNRPATSPLRTECFDIFSPAPGDNEVMSHTDRLSSSETKMAPRSVRIVACVSAQ